MNAELLDTARILAQLSPNGVFRMVDSVATTGSTNADLIARARAGERQGAVLVALEQTAGRGRLDRSWVSPPGASLAISVLLAPQPEVWQWGWLSLLAGMAMRKALAELAPSGVEVELKWPNDVLVGGGKVCGILSERVEHPSGPKAVVGMGLNLTLTQEQLPVPTATSLALQGFDLDRELILARLLNGFSDLFLDWNAAGNLQAEFEARCASIGAELRIVVDDQQTVHGVGVGVDEFGRLLVESSGQVSAFAVGDVVHARLAR